MKNLRMSVITIVVLLFLKNQGFSQETKSLSYTAYLTTSSMLWEKEIASKESILKAQPSDMNALYELVLAQYGFLSATMATKDEDAFNKYLDGIKANLETLIDSDKTWAEPKAILSSVYGFQMGFSPWKGMFLGSKSTKLIEKALQLDDSSPLVAKLYAGSKLFTPEMFGGDVKEAITYYKKSIELFVANPETAQSNWFLLDSFAFLGIAYEKDGQNEQALKTYQDALEHETEFTWIKNVLLPNLENKLEQEL